jgi:hypothetical protein
LTDITLGPLSDALATAGDGATSMEEVANRIVRRLYDDLADEVTGERACALVRFYKTHAFGLLEPGLREFAERLLGHAPESDDMKCLTLLATVGDEPEWNSRARSVGHRAIPLPSEEAVSQIPMISGLIRQFGLDVSDVIKPHLDLLADVDKRTYNAFHVPEAVGSPYIPAQEEFVIPHGVRSVLGFGGMLTTGDLFAVILFAKIHIPPQTADLVKSLALRVNEAVQPFAEDKVFA